MGGVRWTPGQRGNVEDRRFEPPAIRDVADAVDGRRAMSFTPPASLGPFDFPPPYSTRGIRLTNQSNAPAGCDPRLYPYWSVVNNHRGQGHLFVVIGRRGSPPVLLRVEKATLAVSTVRELPMLGTGEGCYFSDTVPRRLYFIDHASLRHVDVDTGHVATVFDLEPRIGHHLWQAHSSSDDQVHSATVKDVDNRNIGAVVYRNGRQLVWWARGDFDECQIDKSGRWLVIQENNENRIIDGATGNERTITNAAGALAHLDVGDGFMVGEDDSGSMWQMSRWNLAGGDKQVLVYGTPNWGRGMGHLAIRPGVVLLSSNSSDNLRIHPLGQSATRFDNTRPVAPGMIDGSDYDHQLRACLDPTGEYACWIAKVDGRFDACLVRLLVDSPLPPPIVNPEPGGSMKQLAIFTVPEDASVELQHDNGQVFGSQPGTADGRPAHIIWITDETLPDGHGAWLSIKWGERELRQHGIVYLNMGGNRARFMADVFEEPKGF